MGGIGVVAEGGRPCSGASSFVVVTAEANGVCGVRVGFVESVEPIQDPQTGAVHAKVDLKLDKNVDPLPTDSSIIVRSKSALGLKYLQINRGNSSQGFKPGSTMPITAARPEPVEIDQVFNMFDSPTRTAIQTNLLEFGNALAGRGGDLTAAIGQFGVTASGMKSGPQSWTWSP